MKSYKIAVPEMATSSDHNPCDIKQISKYIDISTVKYTAGIYYFTRQEIHELVKAHAEKLGYELRKGSLSLTAPWIQLDDSGVYTLEFPYNSENFPQYIEISWKSFLKLTPEDVNDTDAVEIQTPDHNKQALLEAYTAGWDAAHNNRFSIGVNFDKWYHEKAGNK